MVHIMGEGKKKTKRIGHIYKLNILKVKLKIYHYKSCWVKKKNNKKKLYRCDVYELNLPLIVPRRRREFIKALSSTQSLGRKVLQPGHV